MDLFKKISDSFWNEDVSEKIIKLSFDEPWSHVSLCSESFMR